MTGREKIQAAFTPQGTPEFGAVICYEDIFIRDHWDALTPHPWWHAWAPELDRQMAWNRDVIERTGQDWLCLPHSLPRQERDAWDLRPAADHVVRRHRPTGREEQIRKPTVGGWSAGGGVESRHPAQPPRTFAEVERLVSDPPATHADPVADGRADLARALLAGPARDRYAIRHIGSPLWSTYTLWGFEGMMLAVADQPDLVRYATGRFLRHALRAVEDAARLGADAVWIEDGFTDMIAPAAFAALNVPALREVADAARSLGLASIYYYCGDPAGKWEHILAVGADALSLEESKKGFRIDVEDVVDAAAGRCVVLGNLDAIGVLQNATDDQLAAEIRRQLDCGVRNRRRFVMSLGSPVTPATPVARVRHYCDLVHELGG